MVNTEIFGGGLGIKTTKSHMRISIFWTKPLLTFIYTYRRHKSVWANVTSRTLPGYEQLYTQFSRCQRSETLYSPYLYDMCIIWTPGSLPLESASTRQYRIRIPVYCYKTLLVLNIRTCTGLYSTLNKRNRTNHNESDIHWMSLVTVTRFIRLGSTGRFWNRIFFLSQQTILQLWT